MKLNINNLVQMIDLQKVIDTACDYEDGETGVHGCLEHLFEGSDLPDDLVNSIIDAAVLKYARDGMIDAGIPVADVDAVLSGKKPTSKPDPFHGRPVEFELSYGSDVVDTFIESAWFADGECEEISEDLYEQLQDRFAGKIYEMHQEHLIGRAEDLADLRSDR